MTPRICALVLGASAGLAIAQNQTSIFSPVTNWNGAYTLSVQQYDMGTASVPTLQSFASASYGDEWLVLAGRTNGLHGFTNSGTVNFPPASQNTEIWVVDPVTKQTWSKSLSSSGLSDSIISSLSATATQSFTQGSTLFVSGGYVYDSTANNFTTYNTLTAIDVADVVSWVKGETSSLAANSVLQTTGGTSSNGSYTGGFFAVTGGEMYQTGSTVQLVFGQDFEGPYTPGSNGTYTSQVRSFTIDYNKENGTLGYTETQVSPGPGDPTQFRRRDLNVAPSLSKNPEGGAPVAGLIAYSGVFYNGEGVWTVPVEIGADGVPVMADPSNPATFKQAMSNYDAAKLGLYSNATGEFTEFFFGGITANTYNPATGTLTYDAEFPFTSQISAITRDENGNYAQYYAGGLPQILDSEGKVILFGAEAKFFPVLGLPTYDNGVIDLDALTDGTLLGYIYGGIAADAPNNGKTAASNEVFAVYYTAVPEPSALALLALGLPLAWLLRRSRQAVR
jgi:hypothetical protein